MAKNGGGLLAGLTIFTVSTIAFAFLFGFGFQGGQEAYGQARGMVPPGIGGPTPLAGKAYKAYNTRTIFRR